MRLVHWPPEARTNANQLANEIDDALASLSLASRRRRRQLGRHL